MKMHLRRFVGTRSLVAFVVALSLLLALAIFFDWWPMLRGGFGWRWPHDMPALQQLKRILPFLITLLLFLVGVRLLRRSRVSLYIGWCVLGATALPVAALYYLDDPLYLLFTRTISGLTTGGFSASTRIDHLLPTLRQWPELMPGFESFSSHMVVSPPGWAAAYYFVQQVLEKLPILNQPLAMILRPLQCHDIPLMALNNAQIASSWLGIASPFWAALAIIPLYDLSRRFAGDEIGRLTVAWWPLVPSLIVFVGTLSSPYPIGSVGVFWIFWMGFERMKSGSFSWPLIAAGALTAILLLFSLGWLPYLLFLGIFTALHWQRISERPRQLDWRRSLLTGIQFGLGMLVVLGLYTLLTGHTYYSLLQSAMEYHLELERAYWPWLVLHPWDFALFLGLPVFLLAAIACIRTNVPVRTLAVSLAGAITVTVLSGSGRSETGRIWLFFMPFAVLAAAQVLYMVDGKLRTLLLASQIFWLLVIVLVLRPVGTGLRAPPRLEEVAFKAADQPAQVREADFGGMMYLQGFTGRIDPSSSKAVVDLYWQAQRPMEVPYFFSAVLVSPDGEAVSSVNWQPFDYQFPTTCWYEAAGKDPFVDRIDIPMPSTVQSGDYWLSLRAFELVKEGEPVFLAITLPDGKVDDQVGLGPIPVAVPIP